MENIKKFLESIGFSKNESDIYVALVESGDSSVLEISRKIGLHRSNIYDTLGTLIQRGFVFEVKDKESRIFSARSPASLTEYMRERQLEIQNIIKDYETRKTDRNTESNIKVSKGLFAVREALFDLLKIKKEILVYGIPKEAPEKIGPILKELHKERIKNKINMKHIYNSDATERVRFLNELPLTEAKVLPVKYDSYVTTNICGNKIVIILWEKELKVIHIDDEHMSKPYKNYFDVLWKKARVV